MATFVRSAVVRSSRLFSWSVLRQTKTGQPACFISTSKKKKDGVVAQVDPLEQKSEELRKLEEHFANDDPKAEKNWVSFGFDLVDRELDNFGKNLTFFVFISVLICWGGFILAYQPDYRLKHWSRREARLEIDRRTKLGLVPIDANLIDPEKIELPSDEELGDTEIII